MASRRYAASHLPVLLEHDARVSNRFQVRPSFAANADPLAV
jgi:hypothetical protein